MLNCKRRDFLLALGSMPLLAALPQVSLSARRFQPKAVREINISAYHTMLLPREHGQLARMTRPLMRRYPSRDHCMQMAAFFNDKEGILVIGNDPQAGISDWQILPGDRLRIHFYGSAVEPQIIKIEPTLAAAASRYRQWAHQQIWANGKRRNTKRLNFISVASSVPVRAERQHQENVIRMIDGPMAVWFTQWRRYPFDRKYPDYVPKEPAEFGRLLTYLKERDILTMPYINGILWDINLEGFKTTGNQLSLRNEASGFSTYNAELDFLRYACPYTRQWQDLVLQARNGVLDSDGEPTTGVYLDMLAAANPQPCWATNHDHEPGDPHSWQQGIRALLARVQGPIMIEGCAEVYLDQVDYLMMHLHTDKIDAAPLWHAVYGDGPQAVGWNLPRGATTAQVTAALEKANHFHALPSPWMTPELESDLLKRGVLDPRPRAPIMQAPL